MDMEKVPQVYNFDPERVKDRLSLLEKVKSMAYKTYLIKLAEGDNEFCIDFTRPVSGSQLLSLNRLFDIDASVLFSVSDEELRDNVELFLRPEED